MPRYYRRRYTRVVKPKKKWASCITVWRKEPISQTPFVTNLVTNAAQSSTPTPTILKVGNFKVTADLDAFFNAGSNASVSAVLYILFVPEGIQNSQVNDMVTQHPEYIMATKVVGSSIQGGTVLSLETVNVSTRMKRNLNSGDRIVMFVDFAPGATAPNTIELTGNVRYWACTN